MELAQQAQNALVELETEGGTPSGQLHAQRGPKMREAKRKRAEEDMKSILVGGGDEEAETLNGEVGGTTLRVLRSKAVTPQRAPKRGRGRGQARASKGGGMSTLEKDMAIEEGNSGASGDGVHQVLVMFCS